MKKLTLLITTFFLITLNPSVNASEKIFYITNDIAKTTLTLDVLQEIGLRAKSMDIIAPQIYWLDQSGVLSGSIDSRLLKMTKKK